MKLADFGASKRLQVTNSITCESKSKRNYFRKMVLTVLSLWMKPKCVTIQMKAIEQYFHAVLFIMLNKVVLTFKSVDETLMCDHSIERY